MGNEQQRDEQEKDHNKGRVQVVSGASKRADGLERGAERPRRVRGVLPKMRRWLLV